MLLGIALMPYAVLAASDNMKWQEMPISQYVYGNSDLPGAPPPIGFTTNNPNTSFENGPAVGYDANGVVPVTQSLSVGGGPFSPAAVVCIPIPEDFDQDTLVMARWDAENNLWVPLIGSGPNGNNICGATTMNGIFAVVEAGWFS